MKICSSCGFKMLDNQKYCPRCGLPISSSPSSNTKEEVNINEEENKYDNQSKLNKANNKKKNHISKIIIVVSAIVIVLLTGIIILPKIIDNEVEINSNDNVVKHEDEELKNIITYVKTQVANIMKNNDIVFTKLDEWHNRYQFEEAYGQELYFYYPETNEITLYVQGYELVINKDFSFKTTFCGEPDEYAYTVQQYTREETYNKEVEKVNDLIDSIASDKFKEVLDYAIEPTPSVDEVDGFDGMELYLVKVNTGQPNYNIYMIVLDSNGNMYYYDDVVNERIEKIELRSEGNILYFGYSNE